ncbi:hypothetical protein EC973_000708 [Apophysomyces ossiformis]|uniref:J domain-containing protein n=1 Tax=Apophysomyces ossiformis TaxID=679940 RepID=A0A8H7BRB9_9FUNG|nr:hypothetical protein EC973_000708 [Apophysomyces ossiformis]
MTSFPDYYSILEVPETATLDEIRQAYKKQALLHHPDRLPENATSQERVESTRKFQVIADAYYILGDRSRREAYDQSRRRQGVSTGPAMPNSSETQAHHIFSNVFEELLRPEVEHPSHIWRILGAGAGLVLGFIVGNVGGAAVRLIANPLKQQKIKGAYAGKTLGQIRDNKGVSVYTAFERLAANERRDILTALLTRFLTHGASGMMK